MIPKSGFVGAAFDDCLRQRRGCFGRAECLGFHLRKLVRCWLVEHQPGANELVVDGCLGMMRGRSHTKAGVGRGAAFDDVYANDGVASDELNSLVFIYESLCAVLAG